mmetsp:Transcript_12946/g.27959  ORF Transcript_12946/g.27959 Transcript_12946/m.27959 type:complete len:1157 (+) Transcript_12946:55-3525(+)
MVSFKHVFGGGKSSSPSSTSYGTEGRTIPRIPRSPKKGPSLVDLQIHEGEYEELFAVEAIIATLASADEGDTPCYLGTAAGAKSGQKERGGSSGKTAWKKRIFWSPPKFGRTKKSPECRDDGDDEEEDDYESRDCRDDASTWISGISRYGNGDEDDGTLAVDYPFNEGGDNNEKGWLSNVVNEGVKLASATFQTPVASEGKDVDTFVAGHDAGGMNDEQCGDDKIIIVNSKEMVEKRAVKDDNRLFLWEQTKIIADAALRSGNFIAALEMYLVSRELIARYMEGGDLHGLGIGADASTIGSQSVNKNMHTSRLMKVAWIEAEILHSTGEVFLYLSKDAEPINIDHDKATRNQDMKKQQVRHKQMLDEAKANLLDSLVAKQGILCNAELLMNSGAKNCIGDLPFNPYSKHDIERMKMDLSVASTLRLLGNVNTDLGILDDAKEQLRDARNIHLRLVLDVRSMGDDCDPSLAWENKLGLALISYSCGNYFMVLEEVDNALEAYNEALDMIVAVPARSKMMEAALCRASTVPRCCNISDIKVELHTKIGECQYRKSMWKEALLTISKTLNMLNQQMEERQRTSSHCSRAKRCNCSDMAHAIASRSIIFTHLVHVYLLCSMVYASVEDHDEASKALEEAKRARQEVFREQKPKTADPASSLAHILEHVGQHYEERKDNTMALKTYQVALELCEDNSKATSKHGIYLQKYWNTSSSDPNTECSLLHRVAKLHAAKDEYSSALDAYKRAISVRIRAASLHMKPKDVFKGDYFEGSLSQDNNGLIKRRINISHHDRDFISSLQGIEAIAVALESQRASAGSSHSNVENSSLGPEEILNSSETPFRTALDLLVQAIVAESSMTNKDIKKNIAAAVLYRIGMALWKKDKKPEHALASMIKSLERMVTTNDQSTSSKVPVGGSQKSINEELLIVNKADVLESVGGIHFDLGNFEEAKLAIVAALQEQQTILMKKGEDDEERNVALWKIARLSMKAGMLHTSKDQVGTAEQLLWNALKIVRRARSSPQLEDTSTGTRSKTDRDFLDVMAADILHQLGLTLARKPDRIGAVEAYQEAKKMLEKAGKKPDHPKVMKIDEDMEEVRNPNNATGVNDDRSIEGTIDFEALDMYEAHSSMSTSTDWNEYDVMADDLGCGMPRMLERFALVDC